MTIQNDVSSDDRKFYFQLSLFEIKTSILKHCFSSVYGRRLYFKEFYAVIFFTNIVWILVGQSKSVAQLVLTVILLKHLS